MKSELDGYSAQLAQIVDKYPDATRSEYCELFMQLHVNLVFT
ncbi:hypothetical protein QUB30_12295 [Microcoleus sp. BROC3]